MKNSIFKFKLFNSDRGVSIYLAIMTVGILLALALGINAILVGQIKITREMGDSVVAFYAADSGIERVLIEDNPRNLDGYEEELDNGARFSIAVFGGGEGGCDPEKIFCIKSLGTYKKVKRAIEIQY
jgi:hypothetical protein